MRDRGEGDATGSPSRSRYVNRRPSWVPGAPWPIPGLPGSWHRKQKRGALIRLQRREKTTLAEATTPLLWADQYSATPPPSPIAERPREPCGSSSHVEEKFFSCGNIHGNVSNKIIQPGGYFRLTARTSTTPLDIRKPPRRRTLSSSRPKRKNILYTRCNRWRTAWRFHPLK